MVDERATRAVCATSSTVSHKAAVIDSAYGRASMFAHVALFWWIRRLRCAHWMTIEPDLMLELAKMVDCHSSSRESLVRSHPTACS
jgi:hypothetical protein